ncbi:MAG: hypothetical protein AAGM67_15125, partial [Bacteroidota bacterium]
NFVASLVTERFLSRLFTQDPDMDEKNKRNKARQSDSQNNEDTSQFGVSFRNEKSVCSRK